MQSNRQTVVQQQLGWACTQAMCSFYPLLPYIFQSGEKQIILELMHVGFTGVELLWGM